jgi:hypothetical protein
VSTQAPRITESYKQIVPLAGGRKSRPLMGCRARRWREHLIIRVLVIFRSYANSIRDDTEGG